MVISSHCNSFVLFVVCSRLDFLLSAIALPWWTPAWASVLLLTSIPFISLIAYFHSLFHSLQIHRSSPSTIITHPTHTHTHYHTHPHAPTAALSVLSHTFSHPSTPSRKINSILLFVPCLTSLSFAYISPSYYLYPVNQQTQSSPLPLSPKAGCLLSFIPFLPFPHTYIHTYTITNPSPRRTSILSFSLRIYYAQHPICWIGISGITTTDISSIIGFRKVSLSSYSSNRQLCN